MKHRKEQLSQALITDDLFNPKNISNEIRFIQQNRDPWTSQKQRYTQNGQACLDSFEYQEKLYHQCIKIPAPDGSVDQEWCQYKDEKDDKIILWNFCRPYIDFDKIRIKIRDMKLALLQQYNRMNDDMLLRSKQQNQLTSKVQEIQYIQSQVSQKLSEVNDYLQLLLSNKKIIQDIKDKWHKEDNQLSRIHDESIKLLQEQQNKEFLQINDQSKMCQGLVGYESEPFGDGINAYYYNNENFQYDPIKTKDQNIEFIWNNVSPIPGINRENFSIKWIGWLKAPFLGKYTFYMQMDDGAELMINRNYILRQNMGEFEIISGNTQDTTNIEEDIGEPIGHNIFQSKPVFLEGGQIYFIEIRYFHSIHDDFKEDGIAHFKLMWSSDQMAKMVIAREHFFLRDHPDTPRIVDFDYDTQQYGILKEFAYFYKNTEEWIVADIPYEFNGLPSLKFNQHHPDQNIRFTLTSHANVFLGIVSKDGEHENPPKQFSKTSHKMSIFYIKNYEIQEFRPYHAEKTLLVDIYKAKFKPGLVDLEFEKENARDLIIWTNVDKSTPPDKSCGGEEVWVSNPNNFTFHSCQQSSIMNNRTEYGCAAGLSGRNIDQPGFIWASHQEGQGAWITLRTTKEIRWTRIEFLNREAKTEKNSVLELSFGEKILYKQKIHLRNLNGMDQMQSFEILGKDIVSKEITVRVLETYTHFNNGGSMKLYGIICLDRDALPKNSDATYTPPQRSENQTVYLDCQHTLINHQELSEIYLKPGLVIPAFCRQDCSQDKTIVYGYLTYTEDSSICKAAIQAGIIVGEYGGPLRIQIEENELVYDSSQIRGIQSEFKDGKRNSIAFSCKQYSSDDEIIKDEKIIPYQGMYLDVNYDGGWKHGVVKSIQYLSDNEHFLIGIILDGKILSNPIKFDYPDENYIQPCGARIPDRDCRVNDIMYPYINATKENITKEEDINENLHEIPQKDKLHLKIIDEQQKKYQEKYQNYVEKRDSVMEKNKGITLEEQLKEEWEKSQMTHLSDSDELKQKEEESQAYDLKSQISEQENDQALQQLLKKSFDLQQQQ